MDTASQVTITRYSKQYEDALFLLIEKEGDEWKEYWGEAGKPKYLIALRNSITYLIYENERLCGFVRCKDDDGFGIYIHDLLVDRNFRGKEYGRLLMEHVCKEFPEHTIYVMSDVDTYYQKLNYQRVGSIFLVRVR